MINLEPSLTLIFLGKKVPFERFFEKLRSGVLLCEFCDVVNKLSGDTALPRVRWLIKTFSTIRL